MIPYQGDFAEDATILIPFNTFDSNDPSASVTITNLVDADLKVHKDGGLTQIATDGATIAIDYDGVTGNHLVTIDTSVHADYATGSDYHVRMEGTTVDAGTINAWIGSFSIENRYSASIGDSIKAETALIVADTNELQSDDVPGLIATLDTVVDTVKAETALIVADTNELQTDWEDGGRLDLLLDGASSAGDPWGTVLPGAYGAGTAGKIVGDNIDAPISTVDTVVDAILVDTADNQPRVAAIEADTNELQGDDVPGLISTLDAVVDTVKAETALIVADTNELQTDDVPTLISTLDAVVDTVKAETALILTDTGITIPATITTVDAVADAIKVVTDRIDKAILTGTASGTPTTTAMVSDITITADDQFNGRIITFDDDTTTTALQGQQTDITGSTASSDTFTFTALTTAAASGDTFMVT